VVAVASVDVGFAADMADGTGWFNQTGLLFVFGDVVFGVRNFQNDYREGEVKAKQPNPGSDEALKAGCSCPVLDNGHGNGCGRKDKDGTPLFWITETCPLHGGKNEKE
jgi:hypothetical protein